MKTLKKILLFSSFILLFFSLNAQKEILYEDVDSYDVFKKKKFGPNGKNFLYSYLGMSFFTPAPYETQFPVKYGLSNCFKFGYKYKLKIFKWLSVGTDLNYKANFFRLNDYFFFFYNVNQNEKLVTHIVGSEFFFRFNIGKTGNTLGNYFDIGAFGGYLFGNIYTVKVKNKNPTNFEARKQKFYYRGIDFFEPFHYGPMFRVGIRKVSFIAKYRLTDFLNSKTLLETSGFDLPKLSFGIEYAIFF